MPDKEFETLRLLVLRHNTICKRLSIAYANILLFEIQVPFFGHLFDHPKPPGFYSYPLSFYGHFLIQADLLGTKTEGYSAF